jgi:hypothetical protein
VFARPPKQFTAKDWHRPFNLHTMCVGGDASSGQLLAEPRGGSEEMKATALCGVLGSVDPREQGLESLLLGRCVLVFDDLLEFRRCRGRNAKWPPNENHRSVQDVVVHVVR